MFTSDQLAAEALRIDSRLARTAAPARRKRAAPALASRRNGSPDQVYDLVTGRPVNMPGRVAVEKCLRGALKRGDGLALSRALDLAELVAYPGVALLERVAEALAVAEAALDNEPAEA